MKTRILVFAFAAIFLSACGDPFEKGLNAYKSRDFKTAFDIFTPLSEKGDARAKLRLGLMYFYGLGVEVDGRRGIALIEDAAKSGDINAISYNKSREVATIKFYEKSASEGLAEAQKYVGFCYDKGDCGVSHDYKKSSQWYQKAADQGLADAQIQLGYLYLQGKGVPISAASAAEWFRKAAEQGDALGQKLAGITYCQSSCVIKNENSLLSYMLLSLATAAGSEDAEGFRDEVGSVLSPEELARAQAAAVKWKPGTPFPSLKLVSVSSSGSPPKRAEPESRRDPQEGGMSRDEFRSVVIGKTGEQIINLIGRPDSTSDMGGRVSWSYDGKTYDPVTGKIDRFVIVVFQGGIAARLIL